MHSSFKWSKRQCEFAVFMGGLKLARKLERLKSSVAAANYSITRRYLHTHRMVITNRYWLDRIVGVRWRHYSILVCMVIAKLMWMTRSRERSRLRQYISLVERSSSSDVIITMSDDWPMGRDVAAAGSVGACLTKEEWHLVFFGLSNYHRYTDTWMRFITCAWLDVQHYWQQRDYNN